MNRYGQSHRGLTLWLGSDDGSPDGMKGHGWNVSREDSMVLVSLDDPAALESLDVFILPDLFPAVRRAMDAAEKKLGKKERSKA